MQIAIIIIIAAHVQLSAVSERSGQNRIIALLKGNNIMHGPPTQWKKDSAATIKELLGKWLFFMYAIVYAGFILINVFSPAFMGIDIGGLNMAIVYGFGLILFAMLLAFAYNHISTRAEQLFSKEDDNDEKGGDDE
jgi:uncharacterized membrane protein (DUF485 family)